MPTDLHKNLVKDICLKRGAYTKRFTLNLFKLIWAEENIQDSEMESEAWIEFQHGCQRVPDAFKLDRVDKIAYIYEVEISNDITKETLTNWSWIDDYIKDYGWEICFVKVDRFGNENIIDIDGMYAECIIRDTKNRCIDAQKGV